MGCSCIMIVIIICIGAFGLSVTIPNLNTPSNVASQLLTLDQVPLNMDVIVTAIDTHAKTKLRIASMGLRVGVQTRCVRRAVLGGPIQLRLGFTDLVLRKNDAKLVTVMLAPQSVTLQYA